LLSTENSVSSEINFITLKSPEGRFTEVRSSTSIRLLQYIISSKTLIAEILAKETVVKCEKCLFSKMICPLSLAILDSSFYEIVSRIKSGENSIFSVSQADGKKLDLVQLKTKTKRRLVSYLFFFAKAVKHEMLQHMAVKVIHQTVAVRSR